MPEQTRPPAFTAFVSAAHARTEFWRLGLGLAITMVVWLALTFALLSFASGHEPRLTIAGFLFGFSGLILGLSVALRLLHGRRLRSLIGPSGFRAHDFVVGIAVVAGVLALSGFLAFAFDPPERRLAPGVWLAWLPLGLAAVLVQTTAEELVFRGYLQQQLGARFASRLVWMVLPAVAFGALHFDPSFGPNASLVGVAAGVTGLVYGDVTARTGNLSAAMGLHFANNAVALLVLAPEPRLAAFSLYLVAVDLSDVAALRAALIGNIILTLLVYGAWRLVLARRARSLHSQGAGSI